VTYHVCLGCGNVWFGGCSDTTEHAACHLCRAVWIDTTPPGADFYGKAGWYVPEPITWRTFVEASNGWHRGRWCFEPLQPVRL
jgi:hypothetical protein